MDLGKRFKRYREKQGLTQNQAAELLGINNYQIGNYETNRSEPSIAILLTILYSAVYVFQSYNIIFIKDVSLLNF